MSVKGRFPRPASQTIYLVQYADGREYINREPLSKEDRSDLTRRGESFRELKYFLQLSPLPRS